MSNAAAYEEQTSAALDESRAGRWLGHGIEACMHGMIVLTPWLFGAVEPFDVYAYAGLTLMLLLWVLRILANRRFSWRQCPIALGMAALFMLGVLQICPLPTEIAAKLSPQGHQLIKGLLPTQPEVLPFGLERDLPPTVPGSTVSLYPGGTKAMLAQLLAVLLFYVVVRNNCASVQVLRRLALVAIVNGTALAVMGILQYLTSDGKHIYWTIPLPHQGSVFGPFLLRNHFAYYVNVCIGLSIGLLFSLRYRAQGYMPPNMIESMNRAMKQGLDDNPYHLTHPPLLLRSWTEILHDSRVLWICFPLAFMVCGVVSSLSRGGLVALGAAVTVGLALGLPRERRLIAVVLILLIAGGATFLMSWYGFDIAETRHRTLVEGNPLENRLELWGSTWRAAQDFLRMGSGYGTFMFVEPLYRDGRFSEDMFHMHAHNEYLQALLEGGLPRLLLTVGLVGAGIWLALRAMARYSHRSAQGLVMGALIAFLAVVIHSFVDFGLHVTAIALVFAAVVAQISAAALDGDPTRPWQIAEEEDPNRSDWYGIAPPIAAVVLVAMAGLVASEGWRSLRVFNLRQWAQYANEAFISRTWVRGAAPVTLREEVFARKVELLEEAARLAPEYAIVRLQLANAVFQLIKAKEQTAAREAQVFEIVQLITGGAAAAAIPFTGPDGFLVGADAVDVHLVAGIPLGTWYRLWLPTEILERVRPLIGEHLRHLVLARDLYPMLPQPHLRIAENLMNFQSADPRSAYLARAKRLRPFDASLWYECGTQAWLDGDLEVALRDWRRSLDLLKPDHPDAQAILFAILTQAQRKPPVAKPGLEQVDPNENIEPWLNIDQIMDRLVPDQPALVLAAVNQLLGDARNKERRRPFLEKALARMPPATTAEDHHLRALLHISLDQLAEAEGALQRALSLASTNADWRLELGKLYFEMERFGDAVFHLEIVERQRPNDEKIANMLTAARDMHKAQKAKDR